MQYQTVRGLVNVDRLFISVIDALEEGYRYAFTSNGTDLYSKCLDDRGYKHSFALVTDDREMYSKLYQDKMNKIVNELKDLPGYDGTQAAVEFDNTATADLVVGYYVFNEKEYAYNVWERNTEGLQVTDHIKKVTEMLEKIYHDEINEQNLNAVLGLLMIGIFEIHWRGWFFSGGHTDGDYHEFIMFQEDNVIGYLQINKTHGVSVVNSKEYKVTNITDEDTIKSVEIIVDMCLKRDDKQIYELCHGRLPEGSYDITLDDFLNNPEDYVEGD